MTQLRAFDGRLIVLDAEPLRMPLTLRTIPLEGVDVIESADTGAWSEWDAAQLQFDMRYGAARSE